MPIPRAQLNLLHHNMARLAMLCAIYQDSMMKLEGCFAVLRRNRSENERAGTGPNNIRLKEFSKKSPDNANLARGMHLTCQPLKANALPVVKATGGLKASHCYL